jgi:protein pelota
VTPGTPVTISKLTWAGYQLTRLRTASESKLVPIVVIALDDRDCGIAVLRHYGFEVKMELKTKLPGKLYGGRTRENMVNYFKDIKNSLTNIWKEFEGPIVIVGPGFVKNEFANYLKETAPELTPHIVAVKSVSSAGTAGIHEALRCGALVPVTKQVRAAEETREVEEVFSRLGKGRRDVTYSLNEVEKAESYGAINLLLIADRLLREASNQERKRIEELIRNVEEKNGKVMIVSTENEAGEKLVSLGGVAALLRFAVD